MAYKTYYSIERYPTKYYLYYLEGKLEKMYQ
jgi:hypothetical protein